MPADPTLIARLDLQSETLDQISSGLIAIADTQGTHTKLLKKLIEAAETPPEDDGRLDKMLKAILTTLKQNTDLLQSLTSALTRQAKP